jgi:multidrug efflux pump subunit AcrA (membrane-fusion protein)
MALRRLALIGLAGMLALVMIGCGGEAAPTEEPSVEEVVGAPIVVSVTGEVVPAQWAELSFSQGGLVDSLDVAEGDTVAEGDALVELDPTTFDAAVQEAEAALAMAEATLVRTQAGPSEGEIAQAESQLDSMQADLAAAAARRDDLRNGASASEIAAAEATLAQMELAHTAAQNQYDYVMQEDRTDWMPGAREDLDIANFNLASAQSYLTQLQDGDPTQLQIAEAQVWAAAAQRDAAQAALNLLLAQPLPEDLTVAEAQVEQAQAALDAARAAREQATLRAPFAGTVTALRIRASEWAAPGQTVVVLADLSRLQVQTTDLNEIDVTNVAVGNTAEVTFDALPEERISGVVTRIAPRSAEGAGVNYTVTIELDEIPSGLRWGMTAFVDIAVGS